MKTDITTSLPSLPDWPEPSHYQAAPGAAASASPDVGDNDRAAHRAERQSSDRRAASALFSAVSRTLSAPLPQGRLPGATGHAVRFGSARMAVPEPRQKDTASLIGSLVERSDSQLSPQVPRGGAQLVAAHPGAGAAPRRQALLAAYLGARERTFDLERAVAAIKLRRAAEIYCSKNNLARFMPRPPRWGNAKSRLAELRAMPVDQLIAHVQASPHSYSRTLLTDVASAHMMAALNIDIEKYKQGVHHAALYEGLHSVAGRVVSAVAAGASLGVSEIPGHGKGLKAVGKAVKILSHELPPNVVNPLLTGKLRTVTDVKESFLRVGGQPVVMPQIDKSPDMGEIVRTARAARGRLDEAIAQFARARAVAPADGPALAGVVDAFLSLHEIVDRHYRRRIGLNRTQTYSKGWGMAVNGVGVTGAVVSATVPVVGQIVGPAMIGATIPLQWGAGYLDERRNKHRYNFRANMKWADFLVPDAARIDFRNLRREHVSEPALRQSFMTQAEVQIAALREVYEDALGDLVREYLETESKITASENADAPAPMDLPVRHRMAELVEQLALVKRQVDDFESFDAERWRRIAPDSLIGKCLDDLKALEKADRHARLRKPGESAQIVQRYVQAFQAGLSTGTSLPIVDAITSIDTLHEHGDAGEALRPAPLAAAAVAGATGGAVFTAATGEVRMSKADNKKILSAHPPSTAQAPRVDSPQWFFEAAGRQVDLRGTDGYRRYTYTRRQEFGLLGKAIKHGLTSGPIGLRNLMRAKVGQQGEINLARQALRRALDELARSGLDKTDAPGQRADTISAMKDELYDYRLVREHLGV